MDGTLTEPKTGITKSIPYALESVRRVEENLERLSDKKITIASSKLPIFVKKICRYFGIADYFEVFVGSNMDGTKCEKAGVKDKVVMVGDCKYDIYGAHEFGS